MSKEWTPVRSGRIYCSPACGGRCTFAAFTAAHREADKLVKVLGRGWTSRVWENLGWHWELNFGNFQLWQNITTNRRGGRTRSYSAMWGRSSDFRGDAITPDQALERVMLTMRQRALALSSAVREVEKFRK